MDTKEYIITTYKEDVWFTNNGMDGLYHEITREGAPNAYVPYRPVEMLNPRPYTPVCFHFALTDNEVITLRNDPRIKSIERLTSERPGLELTMNALRPSRVYDKSSTTINSEMKNWGLARSNYIENVFGSSNSWVGELGYNLDGEGVDIIVIDSGVAPGHPEFARNADGSGGTRVIDFNWASLGVPGTYTSAQMNGYLGDSDGHGSNCASIAAGNTCGWATKANIYSIRIFEGYSITNSTTYLKAMPIDVVFELVAAFHLDKKSRGITRPTICTNSWGYGATYYWMSYTTFRGTNYYNSTPQTYLGQVYSRHPVRVDSIDASATACANTGVILVAAAGNSRHKCDVPGGIDYDDYYYSNYYNEGFYYLRGMTPGAADGMICVGALDAPTQQKVYFSETGPRVDIYSPGVMIMGAYANKQYVLAAVQDTRASGYYLNKISGTSQACPNVTGLMACVLQARPSMTPAEARQFVTGYSIKNVLLNAGNPSTDDFYSYNNLQRGFNRLLYQPFNSSIRGLWERE